MGRLLHTVDELLALPLLARDSVLPDGVARAAVFDADHCLWASDIGDAAFAAAADAGLIDVDTWRGPVQAWATSWDLHLDDDPARGIAQVMTAAASGALSATALGRGLSASSWKADLYAMQAWVYAGRTPMQIEAHGEHLFVAGFADHIYGDMRRVVQGLGELGIDVWIASASHRALVLPGARRLGIDPARVIGMEPALNDDGLTAPRLHRSTYGPGKARAAIEALGRRPLVAFGDSILSTDKELLAAAHLGVAVATSGDNRAAALDDDHLVLLDPRH